MDKNRVCLGEGAIDIALEESALLLQVQGPVLTQLWQQLKVRSEPGKVSHAETISRTKADITIAERDLAAVKLANLSAELILSVQGRLDALGLVLQQSEKIDQSLPAKTPAAADKERLRLMAAKASWTERRESRREKIGSQLALAVVACNQAATALEEQKIGLEQAAQEYKKHWEEHDLAVATAYDDRIAIAAAMCEASRVKARVQENILKKYGKWAIN
jgi:high-affinity Fe2+/Pb2+ permease